VTAVMTSGALPCRLGLVLKRAAHIDPEGKTRPTEPQTHTNRLTSKCRDILASFTPQNMHCYFTVKQQELISSMFRRFPLNMEQLLDVKNKFKFYVHSYVVHLISRILICTLQTHNITAAGASML